MKWIWNMRITIKGTGRDIILRTRYMTRGDATSLATSIATAHVRAAKIQPATASEKLTVHISGAAWPLKPRSIQEIDRS